MSAAPVMMHPGRCGWCAAELHWECPGLYEVRRRHPEVPGREYQHVDVCRCRYCYRPGGWTPPPAPAPR